MDSSNPPLPGADLLMHLTISPDKAGLESYQDIKLIHTEICPLCKGLDKDCKNCHGIGHKWVHRRIEVKIPKGITEGMRLRLEGLGQAGDYGTKSGDLYIEIHFKSRIHRISERVFNFLRIPFFKKQKNVVSTVETLSKRLVIDAIDDKNFTDNEKYTELSNKCIPPKKENEEKCSGCKRIFPTKNLIQCGPCYEKFNQKKLFCPKCWKKHQWTHGRAPPAGIEYHSDGTYAGFDGSEKF